MSQSEIAHKMDELQTKLQMADSLQAALYVSIFGQDVSDKKDFEWAFALLGFMIFDITKELKELTDYFFEQIREGG